MTNIIKKIFRFILNSDFRFAVLAEHGFFKKMDDEKYINKMYKAKFNKFPNLKEPKNYTEKLQWLKLYDHNPLYTSLVDKYEVKNYVKERIGEKYIIPTLGVWNKFEDIDFNILPNQFVLKTTHDSGGVVICQNKDTFDYMQAKNKIEKSLKNSFYSIYREWPYKDVQPRIIAEKYMKDGKTQELRDYKFFCFDGNVKALFIASDRQNINEETKFDFFDENFNHLPFVNGHPNADVTPEKPSRFDEMKEVAQKLSNGFCHVRVDLYEVDGSIYFGEMTFYHWSGFVPFIPSEWDEVFGNWLILPDHHISNN